MSTPMDRDAADRISAAADRDPDSPTATSGFDEAITHHQQAAAICRETGV
ncbi:hypothetical protein [Amycolatopsis sp. 195334CR]|nr:hypothetical protein [Amycolatopsis sp. 195334CR]MBN6040034.1 hypothetical protein [Amycolatopsis sp. 195334CR]